jgi:hypothetical protein
MTKTVILNAESLLPVGSLKGSDQALVVGVVQVKANHERVSFGDVLILQKYC